MPSIKFCRKLQEEDFEDQTYPEDETSLRSGPKTMMANEEEDPALGVDTPVDLAAMYRKCCAFDFDEATCM